MTSQQADTLIAVADYLAQASTIGLCTCFVVLGWHLASFFMRERSSLIGRALD